MFRMLVNRTFHLPFPNYYFGVISFGVTRNCPIHQSLVPIPVSLRRSI